MFSPQTQAVMDRVDQLRHEVDDHWQIPRDEALVLAQIVRIGRFQSLCEIGVSYGYSTLHLAAAASEVGGHVYGFEMSPKKVEAATRHLTEAGLIDHVTLHEGDARELVAHFVPPKPYDFVFFDATKAESFDYLEAVLPRLARRAVFATDNSTTHATELAPFLAHLRALPNAVTAPVPVGNGFELTIVERGN
ncbi:MAG: class I SAM-dependent methyltransferase [Phycisphaeraceae bacterium]